jgi:hypothetical protein
MATFKEAFREARNAGKKTFTWQGKRYTTELKEEAATRASKAPAGPRRTAKEDTGSDAMLQRMKSRSERGLSVPSNEAEREKAKERTLGALGAASMLAAGPVMSAVRGGKAAATAARTEPTVGRPVTSRLDDAAAAFSKPRAAEMTKSTAKERPKAENVILKPATERGGPIARAAKRKAEEAAAKTKAERSRAMEEAKKESMMRADKKKPSPRSRTRDEEDIEFAKGGYAAKGKK